MPVLSTDIKYYESTNNLGGAITGTEVPVTLHGLFDKVASAEALAGATDYRCVYVKNNHGSITLTAAIAYIQSQTPSTGTSIYIGTGTAIAGGVEQSIADELTPPNGVTFTNLIDIENGVAMGDIPAISHKALWIKRVTSVATAAYSADGFAINVQGDTIA